MFRKGEEKEKEISGKAYYLGSFYRKWTKIFTTLY